MRIRLRYIALFFLLSSITTGVVVVGWLSAAARAPGPLVVEKIVMIAPGSSVRKVARTLEREGAVADKWVFFLAARLQNGGLKAGEYQVAPGASVNALVTLLQSGKTYQRRVTIAEGLTSAEIVDIINAAEAMTGTIAALPPEGSLLPETYSYARDDARDALAARMQAEMKDTLAALWETRVQNLPVATPEQAVILASVVEKETGVAAERARVAGVFVNRLRLGMPLQSDPTVIYALTQGKKKLDRALTFKDLAFESPYNTYVANGLPPGPIANPGRASLEAVLKPEEHAYLYFVADGTGGHVFAATLEVHNRNVAAWRIINRQRKAGADNGVKSTP